MWTLNPARAIVDPQGFWHSVTGALEKLEKLTGCDGERAFEDAWKQLGKDAVHWDEWATDPFRAAGETVFDLGTLLLPGSALEKLPTITRAATDVVATPKTLHLPEPARLSNPAVPTSPPPRSDPPSAGQPALAPRAANGLPAYGLTDTKPSTTTTTQKPSNPTDLRQSPYGETRTRFAPYDPDGSQGSTQRPTESVDNAQTVSAATAPGVPLQPHPPTAVADHHGSEGDTPPTRGLTDARRDEILATPKGSRPDPNEYLTPEYIKEHLVKFRDGVTRFMPENNFDKYGIAQRDGTAFVMPTAEADALIAGTRGDPRAIEEALGLIDGFLDSNAMVRIDIVHADEFDLRLPSGNEAGANERWVPGGLLPDGGLQAVINGGDVPRSAYRVIQIAL